MSIACTLTARAETPGYALVLCTRALDALSRCLSRAEQTGPNVLDNAHEIQMAMFMKQMGAGDIPGFIARSAEVEVAVNSPAGGRDPLTANSLRMVLGFPLMMAGDVEGFGAVWFDNLMALGEAGESHPYIALRHKCGLIAYMR